MTRICAKAGDKYNRWTFISKEIDSISNKQIGWICRCDCGKEKLIKTPNTILHGKSKSCGCFKDEYFREHNPMFNEEIRDKVSLSMTNHPNKVAILAKAVAAAQAPEAKLKRTLTNNERYGGNSPASSADVVFKMANTNIEKRGVSSPAKDAAVLSKMKKTTKTRYGVENVMLNPSIAAKVSSSISATLRNKGVQTLPDGRILVDACLAKGVLPTSMRNVVKAHGIEVAQDWLDNYHKHRSSLELKTLSLLSSAEIECEAFNRGLDELRAFSFGYRPDIKIIGEKTIYLDVDGLYSHSTRAKDYHLEKAKNYIIAGLKFIQIREDEIADRPNVVVSMIKSLLNKSDRLGARELNIVKLTDAESKEFFSENHLMGSASGSSTWALKDSDIKFAISYRKHKNGIDLVRVSNRCGYSVAGGISRLLKHIESIEKPRFIQSFVDLRYASGHSLDKIGFNRVAVTLGWRWTNNKKTFNRMACRANMDDRGLTEAEHAEELGWTKLYDAGQAKYLKYTKK